MDSGSGAGMTLFSVIPGLARNPYWSVCNAIKAFILAADNTAAVGETFIIGGPDYITLNNLFRTLSEIMQKPERIIHLPAKPFQVAGTLCEKICIPFRINPPIYRRRVDFYTKSRAFDITKSKDLLGFEPKVSTKIGLSKTYNWYMEHKWIALLL